MERTDWTIEEISAIYHLPLVDLLFRAGEVHRDAFDPRVIENCFILSLALSDEGPERIKSLDTAVSKAKKAKELGFTTLYLTTPWRSIADPKAFGAILEIIACLHSLDFSICCAFGLISAKQAWQLKEVGAIIYSHSLDSGSSYYSNMITTRNFADRLKTLYHAREADLGICCGATLGMGEGHSDRIELLHTLATFPTHPVSLPINAFFHGEQAYLLDRIEVSAEDQCRMIAAARILMPRTQIGFHLDHQISDEPYIFLLSGANVLYTDNLNSDVTLDLDSQPYSFKNLHSFEI